METMTSRPTAASTNAHPGTVHGDACPVCGHPGFASFFSGPQQPVVSCALYPSAAAASACDRGSVALSVCRNCSYICNAAFDPSLVAYDSTYENALHFSGVYREYLRRETQTLVERYDLRGKRIVEIGCGDGRFLSLLCEIGGNTGLGFDPSFVADKEAGALHPNVRIETRYYDENDMRQPADLIAARQVLEHIANPAAFVRKLRAGLGENRPILSFEVPNAEHLMRNVAVWDMIYEHCNLFTAPSLRRLYEAAGFAVLDVREGFGGTFLTVDAKVSPPATHAAVDAATEDRVDSILNDVARFADAAAGRLTEWNNRVRGWKDQGRRVAIWGAGARVVLFLNGLERPEAIGMVVDINPRKEGFYLPGTGHRVHSPSALANFAPDHVLILNVNYRDEVAGSLAALGIDAELSVA